MRFKRFGVIAALCLTMTIVYVAIASASGGTTYYFSSSHGLDSNPCTQSQPCQSLSKANGLALNPGDSIALAKGDSWTGGLVVSKSGTSTARINVANYGTGALPKITGGLNGDCVKLTGSFITVDGVETDSCGYSGVSVFGSDTTVQNSAASGNAAGLRQANNTTNVQFLGNTLTNNNILNQNTSSGSSGAFGILLNGPAIVANNTISGSDAASLAYGRDGSAVELYNGTSTAWVQQPWIHNNIMRDNNAGIEAGGGPSGAAVEYNVITSNTSADTKPTGIVWSGTTGKLWFSHNSIDLIGSSGQGIVCYNNCTTNSTITSNAVKASLKAFYIDSSAPVTGNVFNGPTQGTSLDSSNSTAAIQWVNPPSDLHELATSPTVDHATVTNFASDLDGKPVPDVAGSKSDSGAYEFQSGGTTSSSTSTTSTTTTTTPTSTTTTPTTSTTTSTTTTSPGKITHIVVITMENQDYGTIYPNQQFETQFAKQGGLATNYYATGHFSLDNYLTMTSGVLGIGNDDSCVSISNNNIFNQLGAGNAVNYEESGNACRHEPASQYSDLSSSFQQPLPSTFTSTTFNPKYVFISPSLVDDGHDSSASTGDSWLSQEVPKIEATPQYQSGSMALVIVYDEASSNDHEGTTTPPDNHIYMAVQVHGVAPSQDATQYTHCSLLRTIEDTFNLPALGCAASATSMVGHFGF